MPGLKSLSGKTARMGLGLLRAFSRRPRLTGYLLDRLPATLCGVITGQEWVSPGEDVSLCNSGERPGVGDTSNPLRSYFDSHRDGRAILKWVHYFDIYHRHFSKFVGRDVHVLEIGVYSGGSLEMWREYFGPKCHLYGVDIEGACKVYENEYTKVFVGDQADRQFWKVFKKEVPTIDILIDDGGHLPEQQIVTLEEMLPHLRRGGVYLCEDVHGVLNRFAAYVQGLAHNLNAFAFPPETDDMARALTWSPTQFQAEIRSISFYPYVTVIEKADTPVDQFIVPEDGTLSEPFLG